MGSADEGVPDPPPRSARTVTAETLKVCPFAEADMGAVVDVVNFDLLAGVSPVTSNQQLVWATGLRRGCRPAPIVVKLIEVSGKVDDR